MSHPTPITTHVLNTSTGQPATNVPCTLRITSPAPHPTSLTWSSVTDANGRVSEWQSDGNSMPDSSPCTIASVLDDAAQQGQTKVTCTLTFDMRKEFEGTESWWEDVEVRFVLRVAPREGEGEGDGDNWPRRRHWHVPVLISPFGVVSYRGS